MNDTETTTLYVNVYDITRVYGGPEEGGWWYDMGELIESHEASTKTEAYDIQTRLAEDYPNTGKRYSVLGGDDYDVKIQSHPGEDFPQYIPRYK